MRITYEQRKEIYDKFRRERRMKITTTLMVGLLIVGIGFLTLGCGTVEPYTPAESETDLQQEWREIYKDVEIPHPPRSYASVKDVPLDYEVELLNYILEDTVISAFRIDPNNPEHQRRYRRHLEEPKGFHTFKETDI